VDLPNCEGRRLRILLVEDGLINQRVATGFLERAGHSVSLANNGREAVDATSQQNFDLVLMDVQMPVMDGHEATAVIREREQETGGHLKIIAMTAAAMKGDRERCLKSGMDAYVSKPIEVEEFFNTIAEQTSAVVGAQSSATTIDSQDVATTNRSNVVDFEAALDCVPGGVTVLKDLAEIFLEECPKLIGDLQAGLAANEATSVHRAAHTLKSSSRIIVAQFLADVTTHIERLAANKELDDVEECLPRLQATADEACDVIREWLNSNNT
jgi:CheY-like chemotaxis protein